MSQSDEFSSYAAREMPIAFPLNPRCLKFPLELLSEIDKGVYLAVLKANVKYLKECADAESRLYSEIGIILKGQEPKSEIKSKR